MKQADLHVHTNYSDSTFSPQEVVFHAKHRSLAAVAICDHDSIDGIQPSIDAGEKEGIEIIPGIELTVEKPDAEIHILGYFIGWKLDWFRDQLKKMQAGRVDRVYRIVEKLNKNGIDIRPEQVFALAGKGSVGRLHVAKVMLDMAQVATYNEAFSKYIGFRKPCYVPNIKFTPEEAIKFILSSGGVPVLAHPGLMGHDEYIKELVGYGLRGLEVYHTDHRPSVRKRYEEIAKELGLIMTGGSDCHGLGKGRILIGNVRVPYEVVDRLRDESKAIQK